MNILSRSLSLATMVVAFAATGAYAQTAGSNSAAGYQAPFASAQYPAGYVDPALSPGTPSTQASFPADENPDVEGATGNTIVRGDRSTITGDQWGTFEQKSGFTGSTGDQGG